MYMTICKCQFRPMY